MNVTTWRVPQPFTPNIAGLASIGTGGELNGYVWKENDAARVYVYCQLGSGFSITGDLALVIPNSVTVYRSDFGNPVADGADPIFGTVMAKARNNKTSFGPATLIGTDRFGLYTQDLDPLDNNTPGNWQSGGWFQISIYGPTRELLNG